MARRQHSWSALSVVFALICTAAAQQIPPSPPSPPLPPGGDFNAPGQNGPTDEVLTQAPVNNGQQFQPPSPPLPPGGDAVGASPPPTDVPTLAPVVTPAPVPQDQPTAASDVPTAAPGELPTPAPDGPTAAPDAVTPAPTAAVANANPNDVAALLAQKAAFSNAGDVQELASWVEGGNPCGAAKWGGVACDPGGNIVSLDLTGLGLEGSLAPELSNLQNLNTLSLGQNKLSGALPIGWAANDMFQTLTQLDLSANQLDGELPAAWGEPGAFSGLQLLRLGSNAFSGQLPSGWGTNGGFSALQQLLLESNQLEGQLPPEWGQNGAFQALTRLDLSGNDLSGTIPDAWSSLQIRDGLVLKPGNDELCGAIPGNLPVLPENNVQDGELVCGAGAPAPEPEAGTPARAPTAPGTTAGANVVGVAYALTGNNVAPWTEQLNQTLASAIAFALRSTDYADSTIRYVGNVENGVSGGRRLLQEESVTVYYNLETTRDAAGLQDQLQNDATTNNVRNALNSAGVNTNSISVDDVQQGGITVPGQSSGGGGDDGLSGGAIAGIVIGVIAGLLLLLLLVIICCCRKRRSKRDVLYEDPAVVKAPTFRKDADDGAAGPASYYRRAQNSPTAAGVSPLPQNAAPVILNADNAAYQGQRLNVSPSPATSPMYPTVKPEDDGYGQVPEPEYQDYDEGAALAPAPAAAPASKPSKFSTWWTGRSAEAEAPLAMEQPGSSPFAPQITPQNDVILPDSANYGSPAAGGGSPAEGGRIADWLRPESETPSPSGGVQRAPGGKKKLSDVVTDIDAI